MKYGYEDLSDDQFEKLIVILSQKLLGISVQGFAKGRDGGRDAKFVGQAELYPSKAKPWQGTVIIQAKHTNGINCSFSDTDFHKKNSKSTIIEKEIPRIINLRQMGELDHYMLFSNRKLTGGAESEIRNYISEKCGIPKESICLCGIEQLELWLKRFPDVAEEADLNPLDCPLTVSPDELAEIVEAFVKHQGVVTDSVSDDPPTRRISYAEKNQKNNMTAEYAAEIRKKYLNYTPQIAKFFANPENSDLQKKYEAAVDDFCLKIISKRKNYDSFNELMEYLYDLLIKRDPVLSRNKRVTRTLLFYMYWHCDIGSEPDASTN
ncbi:MAG: ABC-three component system protein [Zymomonas mobilis]|uniref:ABC-three component system protein n=1 Tax=Zymomonas mobilis TaxID=542 RepID=UPI0039EC9BBE